MCMSKSDIQNSVFTHHLQFLLPFPTADVEQRVYILAEILVQWSCQFVSIEHPSQRDQKYLKQSGRKETARGNSSCFTC